MKTLQTIVVLPSAVLLVLSFYHNNNIGIIIGLSGAASAVLLYKKSEKE